MHAYRNIRTQTILYHVELSSIVSNGPNLTLFALEIHICALNGGVIAIECVAVQHHARTHTHTFNFHSIIPSMNRNLMNST